MVKLFSETYIKTLKYDFYVFLKYMPVHWQMTKM